MRRLYFLAPDTQMAKAIVDDLLRARIIWRHIHVLADHSVTLDELPEASLLQSSDVVHALERGVALGGATGALIGLVALVYPPAELVIAGGAVVALTVVGAGFGAWTAGMIGIAEPNARLQRFREAIKQGQILIMADVPALREQEIEQMIARHFPNADLEGGEPTSPVFP
ncbi:hypothetical protein WT21_03305 [Burkholderia territorii]|uniref:hypothetical protein n=1 Tax=Burkholderia territorii TaxID=1503055 RepID=UPI00075AFA6C|nr:hypothetical protein [Burkholderia territorii]KVG60083.1 hypothetical protein WS79_07875 [Burkholderia territorii]KVL28127.1 hypothetical protein WS97_25815 [Burkholderia territorii]KVN49692.1 hypothetical protein WT12_04415 [Burkholderia territorii]KVQ54746.1 hypothetical protein WT22_26285 [Burkholderia territorii]KVQ54811.1 hypothetical protein WT21_03305 [Burkholderia territorii]